MPEKQILTDIKMDIEEAILEASPSEIFVPPGRQRKAFDEEALRSLATRLQEEGQHTPGLCFINESGVHQLIFGERRLRACALVGLPFRYQLTQAAPSEYALAVYEFSENIERQDLTWREKADAKARLHRLFQERYGAAKAGPGKKGHSLRDTAAYLKQSLGNVAEDIQLAEYAEVIPEVANAKTRNDARKLVEKLKQEVKRDILLEKARSKAEKNRCEMLIDPSGTPTTSEDFENRLAYYDQRVICGTMEEQLILLPEADVILFDPPWGVELDSVALDNASQTKYDDGKSQLELLPARLHLLYERMKPNSHLYLFFGIVHHQLIYDALEEVGFTTNRMPIFWHKEGAHRTRQPDRYPGRCYEAIAFAHKGSKPLVQRGRPDIIPTPPPTPNMKACHPSAKHPAVYRELIARSCEPGNVLIDPMAGSGMSLVAADTFQKELALDYYGIEQSQEFRDLSIFNLARGYQLLVGDTAQPQNLPSHFSEIQPGTPEWRQYWDAHPEEQAEMLEWRTAEK